MLVVPWPALPKGAGHLPITNKIYASFSLNNLGDKWRPILPELNILKCQPGLRSGWSNWTVKLTIAIHYLLIISFFAYFFLIVELYNKTENKFIEKPYHFKLKNNNEIKTDSANSYLGRTRSNFFIFNKPQNKTIIYNVSDINYEEIININDKK